ncbi:MAG: aldo/keto reductase [Anaerolineae bacterium]|nr:aldo/keto reductase [Anaerolineae bacterium]
MQQRRLGRTGHMSTLVIMGTAAFWVLDQKQAGDTLDLALAHGINHIDVAPQYGNAQAVVGPWLESRRDTFFLGCKTLERQRGPAWDDLHNSLNVLRTDHIDLYQLHGITTMEQLDAVFAPGGAMEAFLQARDAGLVSYLGITGHGMQTPAIQIAALDRFDFDTIMLPIYPRLYADPDYRRDTERLLSITQTRDVGVMIIKALARQPWGEREKRYQCWYEPYDDYAGIARSVRFALSQPGVTALPSTGDIRLLPHIIQAAEQFSPMDEAEQAAAITAMAGEPPIFEDSRPLSA